MTRLKDNDFVEADDTQWLNNLRVIATIAVIILHSSYEIITKFNDVSLATWWTGNVYDGLMRFCVPIFVMITGALIIPKEDLLINFLKKRLSRILIPFAFWSIIYMIANLLFVFFIKHKSLSFCEILDIIIHQVKYGSAGHLWYIYMIIGVYLFIPIIGRWARTCERRELEYFLLIWGITLFAKVPLISKFAVNIDMVNFTGYTGYALLGYYLFTEKFTNIIWVKKVSIIALIFGSSITLFGTYFLTREAGFFVNTYYDYLSPNVFIVSTGMFLYVRYTRLVKLNVITVVNFVSRYSYGIYLIHILILILLRIFGFNWEFTNPLLSIPLVSMCCLFMSTLLIYLLNKLPYGKYISG